MRIFVYVYMPVSVSVWLVFLNTHANVFNGAETFCRIAYILGTLLMISY